MRPPIAIRLPTIVFATIALIGASGFISGCEQRTNATEKETYCCEDFKVGTDQLAIDYGIQTEADAKLFGAFMQAASDLAGFGIALTDDVTLACQALATDLGAREDSVQETNPNKKVEAWCNAAADRLETSLKAAGTVSASFSPPRCWASISASASCLASCGNTAGCELSPAEASASCEGGSVSVTCDGGCKGSCEGSARLGVTCKGSCEGTCLGNCDGVAAKSPSGGRCGGVCDGVCNGACSSEGALGCEGWCSGECMGTASAMRCSGKYVSPVGKCDVSADCTTTCQGIAAAKAECSPPSIDVRAVDTRDAAAFTRLERTLVANLPDILLSAQARGQATLDNTSALLPVAIELATRAPNLSMKATICVIPAVKTLGAALGNIQSVIPSAAKVVSKVSG